MVQKTIFLAYSYNETSDLPTSLDLKVPLQVLWGMEDTAFDNQFQAFWLGLIIK